MSSRVSELWEACTDEGNRQDQSRDAMQRCDKRGELFFCYVLQLIHENNKDGVSCFGGFTEFSQQGCKFLLEITFARQSCLGFVVNTDLEIAELRLQSLGKTG